MREIKWTAVRHGMLRAVGASDDIVFTCVNKKRSIWKPRDLNLHGQFNLSAGESRAVTDLFDVDASHTPDWQGDMDVFRVLELTDGGRALLAEWDEQYPVEEPKP